LLMLISKSDRGFRVIGEREPAEHHAHQNGLYFGMGLNLSQLQAPPGFLSEIQRARSSAQHISHRTRPLARPSRPASCPINTSAGGKNMWISWLFHVAIDGSMLTFWQNEMRRKMPVDDTGERVGDPHRNEVPERPIWIAPQYCNNLSWTGPGMKMVPPAQRGLHLTWIWPWQDRKHGFSWLKASAF